MTDYFKIGRIAAAHGIHGQLVLEHSLGKKTSLKGLQTIFIEDTKNSFLPYFLSDTKIKNHQETFLSIEGIATREAARPFIRKEVWLSKADFDRFAAASAPISLLGFHIFHQDKDLGEVVEVIEQPHQVLCTVILQEQEVYIPVHEQSLLRMDKKKKSLHVDIPDGLLDIYLGGKMS